MSRKSIVVIVISIGVIGLLGLGLFFFGERVGLSTGWATPEATATIVALAAVETVAEATPTPLPTATPIPPPPSPTPPAQVSGPEVTATLSSPTALPATTASGLSVQPAAITGPGQAEPASHRGEGLSGTWVFNFGTMTLSQDGVGVRGSYEWYGGGDVGEIKGSLIRETGQFSGLWVSQNNPNEQGFLKWSEVSPIFVGGTFENNGLQGQWCAVPTGQALPPGCGFSGLWNLRFGEGDVTGQADLSQTGNEVRGSYTAADGRQGEIEGSVTILSITEATLTGVWQEANGPAGSLEWRLNQTTNRTFAGRRAEGNSEWCGWREGADLPQPCGFE